MGWYTYSAFLQKNKVERIAQKKNFLYFCPFLVSDFEHLSFIFLVR